MIKIYESKNQNNEKEVIVKIPTKKLLHNVQFKMIDYYGIEITGSDKTQRMYVEWGDWRRGAPQMSGIIEKRCYPKRRY